MKEDEALKSVLQKLGTKYEYKKFIGQGAFSKVYLLHHKILGQNHALKIMDSRYILQTLEKGNARDIPHKFEITKKRFINEARLYSQIDHPNVVHIYDVDVIADKEEGLDIIYILMQFVEGKSLRNILHENSPLEMDRIFAISKDILSAINSIHEKGIVHRDIKPANIIIEKESKRAILIDFGLAKDINVSESASVFELEKSLGTPIYMSPDQFQIHSKIFPGIDLYAFGILLYEMLTGDVPFKGTLADIIKGHLLAPVPDIKEKNPLAPAGFRSIIKKALEKEPEKRYWKAEDLLGDLEKIEHDLSVGKAGKTREKEDNLAGAEIWKLKRKIRKYFLYLFMILAIFIVAAVIYKFVLSPRGNNVPGYKEYFNDAQIYYEKGECDKAAFYLNDAARIKDTPEIRDLAERIEACQLRASMEKDTGKLKDLLKEDADANTMIEEYRKFKDKYGNIKQNGYTKPVISHYRQFITDQYDNHMTDAKEYLEKNELTHAYESLKMAKILKETEKTEELENRIYNAAVSAAKAYRDDAKPLEAEENYLLAKEIKPEGNLRDLEKSIRLLKSMPGDVLSVYKQSSKIEQNNRKYWEAEFRDGIVMVYIPSGKYIISGSSIFIPGYWMGKNEVAVGQYKKFVKESKSNEPEWMKEGSRYNIETGRENSYYKNQVEENFPIVGISWDDASAYCQWLSAKTGLTFKLPSEAQWEKAARGTDGRPYPWGTSTPTNNLANFYPPSRKTVNVNSHPQGASPYGLLNMAGNVEEWCDNQVARGGSFYSNDLYIRCTARNKYDAKERNHALGYRLCMASR